MIVCLVLVLMKAIGLPSSDAGPVSSVEDAVLQSLAEIDTPESDQPYGDTAKHALFSLVYGKTVTIKLQPDADRYQRAVGWLIMDGQIINDLMVARGHAWAWPRYVKRKHMHGLQQAAQQKNIGLWANTNTPIPPWKWRQAKRTQQ